MHVANREPRDAAAPRAGPQRAATVVPDRIAVLPVAPEAESELAHAHASRHAGLDAADIEGQHGSIHQPDSGGLLPRIGPVQEAASPRVHRLGGGSHVHDRRARYAPGHSGIHVVDEAAIGHSFRDAIFKSQADQTVDSSAKLHDRPPAALGGVQLEQHSLRGAPWEACRPMLQAPTPFQQCHSLPRSTGGCCVDRPFPPSANLLRMHAHTPVHTHAYMHPHMSTRTWVLVPPPSTCRTFSVSEC